MPDSAAVPGRPDPPDVPAQARQIAERLVASAMPADVPAYPSAREAVGLLIAAGWRPTR
jgi:hypothetical protein